MPERVVAYVDGFNLYFGLKQSGWRRYYWLDLVALVENLMRPDQTLVAVRYFTSRIANPPDKRKRQTTYLEAIATLPKLTIFYGKYQNNPHQCPSCKAIERIPNEKMTDVNIAVELLGDAYQDLFDAALLISADSDLTAPLVKVKTLFPKKRVILAFPPQRSSKELIKVAQANFTIGRSVIAQSQLSEQITKADGFVLRRPAEWR